MYSQRHDASWAFGEDDFIDNWFQERSLLEIARLTEWNFLSVMEIRSNTIPYDFTPRKYSHFARKLNFKT